VREAALIHVSRLDIRICAQPRERRLSGLAGRGLHLQQMQAVRNLA